MAHSYLDYKDKSVRVHDGLITVVIFYVIQFGRNLNLLPMEAQSSFQDWESDLNMAPPGLININLSGLWQTKDGNDLLLFLLSRVREEISKYGEKVPSEVLNNLVNIQGMVYSDVEIEFLLKEIDKFIYLLQ